MLMLALVLTACKAPGVAAPALEDAPPSMGWDHRPEAQVWTERTLAAVATKDPVLANRVPSDIESWCPAYDTATVEQRRAFWAGLISAVGKYESSWNPKAAGGGGKYIGVMQISPRSAAHHGCDADSASELKDGAANLECAVKMVSKSVASDGVAVGSGRQGIGREWMPFRNDQKRAAMRAWISAQPYCQS